MDPRSPLPPDVDIDPQKLKAARDLLLQFIKTTKTVRLYMANNPIHQKFLSDLSERFDFYLRTHGALRLKVKQQTFLVDGEVVYESDSRQDNLAFRCYVDGISELTFHEGLEQRELVEFLEIVGSERDAASLDDDLVSLLWQRDLPHVTTIVVDDLSAADELPDLAPPKETDLQELVKQEAAGIDLLSVTGPKRPDTPLTVFKLTEEEIQQLKEQLLKEERRDAVVQLLEILSVMLEIEPDETSFGEVLEIMEKLVDLFVDRGDLVHAISCVQAVRRLCENPAQASAGFRNRLQQFMSSVGTRERFETLTTMLNRQKLIDTDLLTRYLELMPVQAVVPMIELLGAINSLQGRRTVCDALAQLARDNVELIAGRLRDDRWYIVRNLIYVMGRIGGPRVVDYLNPLARHPESRVRRELVKTLDGMDYPKAVDALLDMLGDQEHTVRVMVLRALARRKSPRVVQPLSTIITDRHFAGKELSEKLEVFVTLASSGEAEALALLTRYLRGTSWWRRAEQEQLRWCAAYALKQMGTAEALALLEEGSQGRDRHVQEACLAALRGTTRELMMRQTVS